MGFPTLVIQHHRVCIDVYLALFTHSGSQYTFAEVPFDWFNSLIGSTPINMIVSRIFDWSLPYPIAEWLLRKQQSKPWLAYSLLFSA
ncbi:membrane protein [Vibrio mimicus]|nr:membrane protein [Vibrio mimicus]